MRRRTPRRPCVAGMWLTPLHALPLIAARLLCDEDLQPQLAAAVALLRHAHRPLPAWTGEWAQWVRQSAATYAWTREYAAALCVEVRYRTFVTVPVEQAVLHGELSTPPADLTSRLWTPHPAPAGAADAVAAARAGYRGRSGTWTHRARPTFITAAGLW